jgi:UDPglucose 6-dehydrogenase
VKALVWSARQSGMNLSILEAVESTNDRQKHRVFEKLSLALQGKVKGRRVAVWGLAFKANTDDMRESPALTLVEDLLDSGAQVVAHDPVALHEAKRRLGSRVTYADQAYDAVRGADALAIMTDWNEYRHPDFGVIKQSLTQPIIVDGRNLYDSEKMLKLGFRYFSIGRGSEPSVTTLKPKPAAPVGTSV